MGWKLLTRTRDKSWDVALRRGALDAVVLQLLGETTDTAVGRFRSSLVSFTELLTRTRQVVYLERVEDFPISALPVRKQERSTDKNERSSNSFIVFRFV